ncbi:helix-turn-helix domain-containing protein [Shewanella waksmanii]|uniref:helix-turn-helix domain-containing protein n=1 Tax=Shewanella waksmanii TaxID=213783 RepID=UPI003735C782
MILAEKITKLRKQLGWSQEELAEKMDVSRQSVSKWESTNSIPDLNKIIRLADIFEVSTDFLLKDNYENMNEHLDQKSSSITQVSLEQANDYIDSKMQTAALNTKGVILCVCAAIPLFFFKAMAETQRLNISEDLATAIGLVSVLALVAIAVSFFIRTNQHEAETEIIDNEKFELAYGVHSVFSERLKAYRPSYNSKLTIAIGLFMFSFVPLMVVAVLFNSTEAVMMMLILLLMMLSAGLYIIIPASARFDAYNKILEESGLETEKSKRNKRAEKLAAFYWPLITAIYLGWSLWTMEWGVTWIVWPVGAVLFGACVGLMELFNKQDD